MKFFCEVVVSRLVQLVPYQYSFQVLVSSSRSVSIIPEHLNLEEVDTNEKLTSNQLRHLVRFCPNLKRVRMTYLPTNDPFSAFRRQHSFQVSMTLFLILCT